MAPQDNAPAVLPRVLSTAHAFSIVVGIIIGSGIFLVPREMMAAVGSARTVYLVWIAGGLLSLLGALCYAEIATARPHVGGEYAFLREAYGDLPAFLYAWTWVTVAKPASIATIAIGLMRVLATFTVFSFLQRTSSIGLANSTLAAIAATWLITALNIAGTRESANVQNALTGLKIALILTIAAACFGLGAHLGSWTLFSTGFPAARGGVTGFMVALVAALWAYDGWSDVTQMAGEVRHPQRALPRALVGGVLVVGLLYMLTNAAIQFILPAASIATSDRPTSTALTLIAGHAGATLVSIGMAISIGATFVGSSLSGARVPFAAARDGLFPQALARVSPRFQTPAASLTFQAAVSTALLLAIGKFQSLLSLAIFSEWLFYALTASTLFVFRRRQPDATLPFRVPFFPFTPIVFIAAAAALLCFSFAAEPRHSLIGTLIIALGVPLFYLRRHTARSF